MLSRLAPVTGSTLNHDTTRSVRHKFKVRIKGVVPAPEKAAVSIPLLGESSTSLANLKEGYIKNMAQYWMDKTNIEFSAERDRFEHFVKGGPSISPALGPLTSAKLKDCPHTDFETTLHHMSVRAMNEYYRNNLTNRLKLLNDKTRYGNYSAVAPLINAHQVDSSSTAPAMLKISDSRTAEQNTDYANPVSLIFDTIPPRSISTGTAYTNMQDIEANILAFEVAVVSLVADTADARTITTAIANLVEDRERFKKMLDLTAASQEIFGYEDITCLERTETAPYIPFKITWKPQYKKVGSITKLVPHTLPLGIPFILRLFLRTPAPGTEHSELNIDLGDRLRLSINHGEGIKIFRKRSEEEVTKFLSKSNTTLTKQESDDLNAAYTDAINTSGASIGFGASALSNIEKVELMIQAYKLSLALYNTTAVNTPGNYADALGALTAQKEAVDELKAQITTIRKQYADLAKTKADKKLSVSEKAMKDSQIDTIRKQIRTLRNNSGKNEQLRRKIANLHKIVYTNGSGDNTVKLDNVIILDTPLTVKVTDYGMGIVLFEFNEGRHFHVFVDAEHQNKAESVKNKLGGVRSGGTGTNRIKLLGQEAYTWTIAEHGKNGKESGGRLVISGTGGSFLFAYDDVNIPDACIYIPVAIESNMSIVSVGPASSTPIFGDIPTGLPDIVIPNPEKPGGATNPNAERRTKALIPVDPNAANYLDPLDAAPSPIKLDQDYDVVLTTNLPAYSDGSNTAPDLVDFDGHVAWNPPHRGGSIKVDLMPGADPKVMPNVEDMPGFAEWVEFLSSTASTSGAPGTFNIVTIKPQFVYYQIRVTIKPNRDANFDPLGMPLLFSGALNILAKAKDWDDYNASVGLTAHEFMSGGPGWDGETSNYTIEVEPGYDSGTRRSRYQVTLTYKEGIPTNPLHRMPDFMAGKLCDILYLPIEEYENANDESKWIPVCTDGCIVQAHLGDMLTITQPQPSTSPLPIRGFYQYNLTKMVFNVHDSLHFLSDMTVSEGFIYDGYHLYDAAYSLLRNGGFPDSKMTALSANKSFASSGSYINPKGNLEKYAPMALPGQKHRFAMSTDRTRWSTLEHMFQSMGWITAGNLELWVDHAGNIDIADPIRIFKDPRYNNAIPIYRTRAHAQDLGGDTSLLNNYIYFSPTNRIRNLNDFFTLIKVVGGTDYRTGRLRTMVVGKREAVSSNKVNVDTQLAQENPFLGHHKPLPSVHDGELMSRESLAEKLYFLYNKYTFPQDVWEISVPFNPFVRPNDVIFVAPDNARRLPMFPPPNPANNGAPPIPNTTFFEPFTTADYEAIAWKVVDCVDMSLMEDRMTLKVTTLNKEEKKLFRLIA